MLGHFHQCKLCQALRVRWHYQESVIEIVPSQRLYPAGGMICKIICSQVATLLCNKGSELFANRTIVVAALAFTCNRFQGVCQCFIDKQ